MRMLKPDPGELADRQTVLQLKMEHGQSYEDTKMVTKTTNDDHMELARTVVKNAGKINIKPFHDEHELIQRHLEMAWFPNIAADKSRQAQYDLHHAELLEVNSQLWKLEDQARILGEAPEKFQDTATRRAAEVLFAITNLNDKRSELVKKINAIWNINTQEKMYA